jgi:hypothetical protein
MWAKMIKTGRQNGDRKPAAKGGEAQYISYISLNVSLQPLWSTGDSGDGYGASIAMASALVAGNSIPAANPRIRAITH